MSLKDQALPDGKIRLEYIDALRGIAATMVLLCHSLAIDSSLKLPNAVFNILEAGKYGVQLFFVISALTIFYSLHNSDKNTFNFFIRRFFRIAPLYFLAVLTYSFLYPTGDLLGLGLNLTFLHGFSPQHINSVVPGGWSIGVEMVFYCMIPFLFKRINNLERAIYFFCATLVFSFLSMYVYRKLVTSTSDLEFFVYFWLPNQLPIFALGFVVFFLSFKQENIKLKNIYYPVAAFCLIVLAQIFTKLTFLGDHLIFAVASATLLFLCSKKPFPGLANRLTLYLGKVSYSLYLSQYAAMFILYKAGVYSLFPGDSSAAAIINIAINVILLLLTTCSIATLSYHCIEVPFQKMGRSFLIRKPLTVKTNQPLVDVLIASKKNM